MMVFGAERFPSKLQPVHDPPFYNTSAHPSKPNVFAFNSTAVKSSALPLQRIEDFEETEFRNLLDVKYSILSKQSAERNKIKNTFSKACRFPQIKRSELGPGSYVGVSMPVKSESVNRLKTETDRQPSVVIEPANNPPTFPSQKSNPLKTSYQFQSTERVARKFPRVVINSRVNKSTLKVLFENFQKTFCSVLREDVGTEPPPPKKLIHVQKTSSVPTNRTERLELVNKEVCPGPGQYEIPSCAFKMKIPPKKFQIFGSAQARFNKQPPSTVCPGQYDPYKYIESDSASKITFNKAPLERSFENKESFPGPGSYEPKKPAKKEFRVPPTSPTEHKTSREAFHPRLDEIQASSHFQVKEVTTRVHKINLFQPLKTFHNFIPTVPSIRQTVFSHCNSTAGNKKSHIQHPTFILPQCESKCENVPTTVSCHSHRDDARPLHHQAEQARNRSSGPGFLSTTERFDRKEQVDSREYNVGGAIGFKSFNILFNK